MLKLQRMENSRMNLHMTEEYSLQLLQPHPTLISETEAHFLIFDKTFGAQGPHTTQSTTTLVPGICDSKSGPVKPRSQSITSKFHRTSGTRLNLIREMFKQDSKRKREISQTLDNSHDDSTVASHVYPLDACSTKHSNLVS